MTSFGYLLNPRHAIKECLSCGALYTRHCSCSKGSVEDKVLVPKPPKNCARCAKCGHPVNGPYCQGCALLREKLEEDLVSCLKYFHDTSESFDDSTNDRPIICCDDDDDEEDYAIAVTPNLSTEEPNNPLSMGDEHLDTVPATKSDELIKSSVKNLVRIPNQFEDFSDSNDESTSIDDDSFSIDNIEYVEASPPNFELVSSEVMEIFIPKAGGIEDDILLTIKDDILREKLLNINLLIANNKALNDNPTPSSNFITNSGSTTARSDISLPEYEVFYDDHVKEIISGSTTTHSDSSLYNSFIFDISINPFPPANRSDFYEFADELSHIISPPEYDYFCFKIEPNSGDFTIDVVEDISPIKEPRVHNALPTHPNLQLNLDFILSS
uniref:Pre-mRNA splicing Prp18-interacting factor n=1 Tax=Tanacetum cinerariifolium TaxID=118510 RepID=A0A6L2NUL5_TANCI|nr:hypothetical protein [Tanacetum cinerariifolium]